MVKRNGKDERLPGIENLNAEQLFFISLAQVYKYLIF